MTTFGHRVIAAVKEAKQNNLLITADECAEIINRMFAKEKPAPKAKTHKPYVAMTEEEFIDFLENEPALQGIDVKREIGKCQFWCKVNGKQPSRNRIVKWMQRADRPMNYDATGKSSFAPKNTGIPPEPTNWRQRVDQDYPGNQITTSTWEHFYKQHPSIARNYL